MALLAALTLHAALAFASGLAIGVTSGLAAAIPPGFLGVALELYTLDKRLLEKGANKPVPELAALPELRLGTWHSAFSENVNANQSSKRPGSEPFSRNWRAAVLMKREDERDKP